MIKLRPSVTDLFTMLYKGNSVYKYLQVFNIRYISISNMKPGDKFDVGIMGSAVCRIIDVSYEVFKDILISGASLFKTITGVIFLAASV